MLNLKINNVERICRICLKVLSIDESACASNIFKKRISYMLNPNEIIIKNGKYRLSDVLQLLTSITFIENDNLPKIICSSCEYRVIDAYILLKLIENSTEQLNKQNYTCHQQTVTQKSDTENIVISPAPATIIIVPPPEKTATTETLPNEQMNEKTSYIPAKKPIFLNSFNIKNEPFKNVEILNLDETPLSNIKTEKNIIIEDLPLKAKEQLSKYELNNNDGNSVDDDENAVNFILTDIVHKLNKKTINLKKKRKKSLINHRCLVCNRLFRGKSNLVDHLRMHANIRPFKCNQCDKSFVQIANYQQHLRIHTKEKPYACTYPQCTKSYSQSSTLRTHLRSHFQIKPYECSVCDKRFTCSSDLAKHRKRHFIDLQIKCDECDRTFAQKGNYRKHKLKHHSNSKSGE